MAGALAGEDDRGTAPGRGVDLGGAGEVVALVGADGDQRRHRTAQPAGGLLRRHDAEEVDGPGRDLAGDRLEVRPVAALAEEHQPAVGVRTPVQRQRADEHLGPLPLRHGAGVDEVGAGRVGPLPLGREGVGVDAVADDHDARVVDAHQAQLVGDAGRHREHDRRAAQHPGLDAAQAGDEEGRRPRRRRGVGPHVSGVVDVRNPLQRSDTAHDEPGRRWRLGHEEARAAAQEEAQGRRHVEAEVLHVAAHVAPGIPQHGPPAHPQRAVVGARSAGRARGDHLDTAALLGEGVGEHLEPERRRPDLGCEQATDEADGPLGHGSIDYPGAHPGPDDVVPHRAGPGAGGVRAPPRRGARPGARRRGAGPRACGLHPRSAAGGTCPA